MTRQRKLFLALIVVLLLAAGAFLFWLLDGAGSIDAIQARIASLGHWAPVGFVVLYAVATVVMVPGGFIDVIGGVLFGPVFGSLCNLAGGTLGAALAFLVARYLAAEWVERRAGPRVQGVVRHVEQDGWQFVAFVRLVPVFPYNVANYLFGLTRIPFMHYVLATMVFMAPSTVAYTWLGYAGGEAVNGDASNIRYALGGLAVLAILAMAPRYLKRWRAARAAKD